MQNLKSLTLKNLGLGVINLIYTERNRVARPSSPFCVFPL